MPSGDSKRAEAVPPAISVLICAYTLDRIGEIEKAIKSVHGQTVSAEELVLAIDHSPELLEECHRRWPDIKIVENQQEQGLSGARNSGVAACVGGVVAFLDDDAVAAPDWLERIGRAYADPAVLGVGGAIRPDWAAGRPRWFPAEFDWVVGCTHSGMPQELAPVRNLVGANMSFRRDAILKAGGFRHELGRVGTIPAGCEETDLCIRIAAARPDGRILYDPQVSVDHLVPAARGRLRYFVSRCRAEGRSKAVLAGLVGSESGLEEERAYTQRTLPAAFLRGLGEALRGDPAGVARSAMLGVGLSVTTAGYLSRARERRRIERRAAEAEADRQGLRLLIVTPRSPLAQGGVERHVLETSRRLAEHGALVEVLCTEPGGPAVREEHRDGVTIRTVRAWPKNRDWCLAPRLWREMSRRHWDIVHIQSYHTFVAPLTMLRALTLGIPYVVTFHGGGHSSTARNRSRRMQRSLLRPLLARAERLVAVARFEIDEYGEDLRLPPEMFALIPNGTDLAFVDQGASPNGQPDGPPSIASIGRLERYKGHHRVIAAFPHLLSEEPDARLLIVGTGPYEKELRNQAAELGIAERVEFTSTPSDQPAAMAGLLARISLVALLSEFETHPLVALEAAAAGRRLLVADAGGLAELAEDGFARAIPLETSPEEIARAMVEELSKPPPSGRPKLSSWDECTASLLALYRAVA